MKMGWYMQLHSRRKESSTLSLQMVMRACISFITFCALETKYSVYQFTYWELCNQLLIYIHNKYSNDCCFINLVFTSSIPNNVPVSNTQKKTVLTWLSLAGTSMKTINCKELPATSGNISIRSGILAVPGWEDEKLHLFSIK